MVSDRAKIRKLLLRSHTAADGHMEAIRRQIPLTYPFFRQELRQYVLEKYLLTEEDIPEGESFHELAEISLSKSMQVSPELVEEFDTASSCDGATSVMAKKVLLFMAMEKALRIQIPALESARLKTLEELTTLLWNTMKASPLWQDRMEM